MVFKSLNKISVLLLIIFFSNSLIFCYQRHLKLDESITFGKEIYVFGDVHGCLTELKRILDNNNLLKPNGQTIISGVILILAGDVVNKGPLSCETLEFIDANKNIYSVRGNHEDNILKKGAEDKYPWLKTCASALSIVSQFPYTIEVPQYNAIVVHAGLLPDTPLNEQSVFAMTRMRNLKKLSTGELKPYEETNKGKNWLNYYHGPKHVYFAHAAKRRLQILHDYATGLDTACVSGEFLTAVKMPAKDNVFINTKCGFYEDDDK